MANTKTRWQVVTNITGGPVVVIGNFRKSLTAIKHAQKLAKNNVSEKFWVEETEIIWKS